MATELFELPFLRLTFFVDIPPGSVQRNHPHLANRSSRRSISIAVDCHPQHERRLSRDVFSVRKVLMCFECNYTIPVCAIINFRCGWALFCLGQHYWRNLFWIQHWIYLPVPFSTKVTVNVDNGTEYFTGVIDGARQQLAQDKTDYSESFHNNEMKKKRTGRVRVLRDMWPWRALHLHWIVGCTRLMYWPWYIVWCPYRTALSVSAGVVSVSAEVTSGRDMSMEGMYTVKRGNTKLSSSETYS